MNKITVVRAFKHADEIHPVEIAAGDYAVEGRVSRPADGTVSPRAAEVAVSEGWAVPLDGKPAKGSGRRSRGSGPEAQSASSQAAPPSTPEPSSESDAGDAPAAPEDPDASSS